MGNSKVNETLKKLRRYKIEQVIHWSSLYSLSYITYLKSFHMNGGINVFPWDIDSMLLIKIFIGTSQTVSKPLTEKSFQKLILELVEYDYSLDYILQGRLPEDIVPIIMANQFTNQMDNRLLLFRSMYFYKYCDSKILSELYFAKYGIDVERAHQVLLGIYGIAVTYKDNPQKLYDFLKKIRQIGEIKEVLDIYTISLEEFEKLLKNRHQNPVDLIHENYYLKLYCSLRIDDTIYLVYPHNIIHIITYGTLYKLTEYCSDTRTKFGKEVLEDYLYHLCKKNSEFSCVSKEVEYFVSRNRLLSSDVLAVVDNRCLFIESKSSVIKADFRNPLYLNQEQHYIDIYSENLYKLYVAIVNHAKGLYSLFDTIFDINDCFGVVVNLEDSHISRIKVFNTFFKIVESKQRITISEEFRQWVQSHLRIIDLYDFERVVLTVGLKPVNKFFSNKWTDLTYNFNEANTTINEEVARNSQQLLKTFGDLLLERYGYVE